MYRAFIISTLFLSFISFVSCKTYSYKKTDIVNLKQIGLALKTYCDENNETYPDKLSDLWRAKILTEGKIFVSPGSKTPIPKSPEDIDKGHVDYVYLAYGGWEGDYNAETVMAFTKPGIIKGYTSVMYGDAHVKGFSVPNVKDIKSLFKALEAHPDIVFNKRKYKFLEERNSKNKK